jgi:hypothetical protein
VEFGYTPRGFPQASIYFMSLYQSLYFMSLVGGMAGLFSWASTKLISLMVSFPYREDFLAALFLGGFIGGLTVAFSDHWSGNRVLARWVFSGIGLGLLAGLLGALVYIPIRISLIEHYPLVCRVLFGMLIGSFIGLGLGLRWANVNRTRVAHAFTGGLIGGGLGGLIWATMGHLVPEVAEPLEFVLTGVGICCGVTLAPILLRQGVLQFVSSGDGRAQSKFGRNRKQWEVQEGDRYVIGSQSPSFSQTSYRPEIEIFIPDVGIAPRHAILFARDGKYYLERHRDTRSAAGMARYILRVRGKTVPSSQELQDSDDLVVGRTALRFMTRRRAI